MTKISTPAKMSKTPVKKDLSMKMKKSPKNQKSPKTPTQTENKKEKLENGTPKPKSKHTKTPIKEMKLKKEKPTAVTSKKEAKDVGSPKKSEKPAKRKHNKEIKSKGESPAKKSKNEKTEKPKQEFKHKEKKVYENCVFVGGLFYATTLEKVELLFKQFGKVLNVTMPMSKKTHNKGYAFVSFVSKASMDKALAKSKQLTLDSKKLAVEKKNKPATAEERKEKYLNKKLSQKLVNNSNKIFVAKLKRTTSKKAVLDHFSKYGAVSKVMMPSFESNRNRGFCFVAYKETTSMEAALNEEQHNIEDTELDVQPSALKTEGIESSDEEDVDDEDVDDEDVDDEDVDDEDVDDEDVDDEDVDDEDVEEEDDEDDGEEDSDEE